MSNETIKKALLGATIIAGGFGLMGNTNEVYADSVPSYIADELEGVYDETIIISKIVQAIMKLTILALLKLVLMM